MHRPQRCVGAKSGVIAEAFGQASELRFERDGGSRFHQIVSDTIFERLDQKMDFQLQVATGVAQQSFALAGILMQLRAVVAVKIGQSFAGLRIHEVSRIVRAGFLPRWRQIEL